MKIVTWNMKRGKDTSPAWIFLSSLKPDIALLQEVVCIPDEIRKSYQIKFHTAVTKTGKPQSFGTAILVRGKISDLELSSEHDWVNRELDNLKGNILSSTASVSGFKKINIISVHSPAWPIDENKYVGEDVYKIKLKQNRKLWATEILWSALNDMDLVEVPCVVGGDLNCSETFDETFSSGNKEILDRMKSLGLTECLKEYNGTLTPTFRNASNKKIIHQIDHLFVNKLMYEKIDHCEIGNSKIIFDKNLSDHLPIIAVFK